MREEGQHESPRSVSRGLDLQIGFMGLDSLYLLIEYPHADLYKQWSYLVKDASTAQLHQGIEYQGYTIRNGAHGYPLSVWDGDARLYITGRVNEALEGTDDEGQGMGALLQVGPLTLRQCGEVFEDRRLHQSIYALFANFGVKHPAVHPIRINRADLTCDVVGLDLSSLDVEEWRQQWVGAAKPRAVYYASSTGMLEGCTVGSSSGSVAFRMYDKVLEAIQRGKLDFWRSVWGLETDELPSVTRFEWAVKCYQAEFVNLSHLEDLTFEAFLSLLNYVTLKWGRLCIPQENDSNQSRWPLAPLWAELRRLIDDWSIGYEGMAGRAYHYKPDINGPYLTQLVGWISGFMARAGLKQDMETAIALEDVFPYLEELGRSGDEIADEAGKKYKTLAKRMGAAK